RCRVDSLLFSSNFFFFQAEDGIRYWSVTGVQTCALPILGPCMLELLLEQIGLEQPVVHGQQRHEVAALAAAQAAELGQQQPLLRSEERRVGKEGRVRGVADE